MKILALTGEFPPFRGGIATYAAEMARAAHELGAEVTLAAPDYGGDLAAEDRRTFPFDVVRYGGAAHQRGDALAKLALVRRLFAAGRYDLVHAMDWPFFLPTAVWCRSLPRIYTLHGSDVLSMARAPKRAAIRLSRMFDGRVRILANSRFTEQLFRTHFPAVAARRIAWEHLGVSQAWLDHRGEKADRPRLGLPAGKTVVITVARVTRRKGHHTALEALARLPAELRDRVAYAIVGPYSEADYRAEIEALIARSPVEVVRFESPDTETVMDLCAASDVFCLPGARVSNQLVEGFGLVFLEAGSQGLPLVAGRVGATPEVVEDGVNGIVVEPDDPDALARALAVVVGDNTRRRALAEGARQRAERLTWRRCAAATYGLSDLP